MDDWAYPAARSCLIRVQHVPALKRLNSARVKACAKAVRANSFGTKRHDQKYVRNLTGWVLKTRKNYGNHIAASHSRQPLVKGERLVRYEVNAVMLNTSHCHCHHQYEYMYW